MFSSHPYGCAIQSPAIRCVTRACTLALGTLVARGTSPVRATTARWMYRTIGSYSCDAVLAGRTHRTMGQTLADPVSKLPTELLTIITASFSPADIASTLTVSSAWRVAFSRTVQSIRPHGPLPAKTKLSRPFPKLQQLYLERCEGAAYTDEHVKDVAQLPDLQHLSLEGFRNCTDEGVAALACLTGEATLAPVPSSVASKTAQEHP